jgi:hypothetical protein
MWMSKLTVGVAMRATLTERDDVVNMKVPLNQFEADSAHATMSFENDSRINLLDELIELARSIGMVSLSTPFQPTLIMTFYPLSVFPTPLLTMVPVILARSCKNLCAYLWITISFSHLVSLTWPTTRLTLSFWAQLAGGA